jgi:predicted phage terminase large subunit-like protein
MSLTVEEELELIALMEAELYERARNSLAVYAEEILEMPPAKHHLVMVEGLEEVERRDLDVLIITLPPGSAKSSYGSVAFPAWYLGRNPKNCVIAASHTGELAERFGRKVRNTIQSQTHQNIFPTSKVASDSAAAGRWETSERGEYFAAGVGGSITGRRADLAIIDDPVKSREEADSATIRQKQWDWWRDDLMTRLKPGAGVVIIMTRWHEDDLAGRLINDLKLSNKRVKIISIPMEAREDDPLGRAVGEPLWPEWFTPIMIEEAKREPRTWSALYQQEPRPIGGGEFKKTWLNHWIKTPATGNRVILVDPSSGKYKTRGDFTSMWVIGRGADNNIYVLDGVRDRLNLTERSEALFQLVRKWKPAGVGYEQYGLQADIEFIKNEQERQQYRFKMIELGGSIKKEDRIRRLIPLFESSEIWLPESLTKQSADGNNYDVIKAFVDEYSSFPVGAHDDALDNLARLVEPAISKILLAPQQQERPMDLPQFAPIYDDMGY